MLFETENQSAQFSVQCEKLSPTEMPIVVTQSEFMRRMKDMSAMNPQMSFYGQLPDSYNLIVNTAHPIIEKINEDKNAALQSKLQDLTSKITTAQEEKTILDKQNEGKKNEEIPSADKEKSTDLQTKISNLENEKRTALKEYAKSQAVVKQLIDLALISNNMLKGEDLEKFVHRSVELIK